MSQYILGVSKNFKAWFSIVKLNTYLDISHRSWDMAIQSQIFKIAFENNFPNLKTNGVRQTKTTYLIKNRSDIRSGKYWSTKT